jgi:hypothetical protein
MDCPKCREASPEGSNFCMYCGTNINARVKEKIFKKATTIE